MRMLIVGAGAIGGYYGGRLAQAGRDVTFLVRPKRAAQLQATDLQIKSPNGDLTIAPQLLTADRLEQPYDAVLLAVKGFSLEAVMADFAPAVGPETMILPVLNGMKHVDILSARFGAHAVAGCACRIAVELDDEGRIVQLNPPNDMAYGEMDGAGSARITALDAFMQNAGFNARLSPAIAREMWEKWILLAGLGGINCLMRGSIGEVEAAPGGVAFVEHLLDEIVAVVKAAGVPPSSDFITFAHKVLTAKDSQMTSSMYRDLLKGAPIEADQIIGDLLVRGSKSGIATPLIAAVYAHLSVYQARLPHRS
jgi:2-dehydropantoate 2-reductase